jgi:hypothetical protein
MGCPVRSLKRFENSCELVFLPSELDTTMAVRVIILAVLLSFGPKLSAQPVRPRQDRPKFMGREVTVIAPERDADGFPSKGPASVCVEGPPQRQCYTAPEAFGSSPTVAVFPLAKDLTALFFSAQSYGVSGWGVHFALLRPGMGKDLANLFWVDPSVSNQSQNAFWNESTISEALIFVTADYIRGPDEGHYGEHRYIVSAYVLKPSTMVDDYYYLEDRYMTAHKYDLEANSNADVLTSEKPEIIGRLRRLKAEAGPQR